MIVVAVLLSWLGNAWIYPAFVPFLIAWILCFFLGLVLSKIVRNRVWIRQKHAAAFFLVALAVSYLPVVAYWGDVANTLAFPAMAALQGVGTAFGFHLPWLHSGRAGHNDVEGIDDLMSALDGRKR